MVRVSTRKIFSLVKKAVLTLELVSSLSIKVMPADYEYRVSTSVLLSAKELLHLPPLNLYLKFLPTS